MLTNLVLSVCMPSQGARLDVDISGQYSKLVKYRQQAERLINTSAINCPTFGEDLLYELVR
jgi:hypothetical protein